MRKAPEQEALIQPARLARSTVVRTYTWIAPVHDLLGRLVESRARCEAFDLLDMRNGQAILEVAVGTGLNLPHVVRANPDGCYVGADLTPAMLRQAGRKLRRLTGIRGDYSLVVADAYSLPFSAGAFDVLINSYMFDMMPAEDFVPVLQGFTRVLRPGGRLLLINMTPGPRRYHRFWENLYRLHPPFLGGCRGVRLKESVLEAGLEVVSRSFVSQWTFPSEILLCRKPAIDQQ